MKKKIVWKWYTATLIVEDFNISYWEVTNIHQARIGTYPNLRTLECKFQAQDYVSFSAADLQVLAELTFRVAEDQNQYFAAHSETRQALPIVE